MNQDFDEALIRERIQIRTQKLENVMSEYNELQRKLDVLQEKADFLAYKNFEDHEKLNKITQQNQNHGIANATI